MSVAIAFALAGIAVCHTLILLFTLFILYRKLEVVEMNVNALDAAIASLQTDVANEATVIDGAVKLINGISAQIAAAVAAATAAGATPAQLQALTDLDSAVKAKASQLAAAVASAPSGTVASGLPAGSPAAPAA